jgi:hypothetical protein
MSFLKRRRWGDNYSSNRINAPWLLFGALTVVTIGVLGGALWV